MALGMTSPAVKYNLSVADGARGCGKGRSKAMRARKSLLEPAVGRGELAQQSDLHVLSWGSRSIRDHAKLRSPIANFLVCASS
jgi:hypothetical protein